MDDVEHSSTVPATPASSRGDPDAAVEARPSTDSGEPRYSASWRQAVERRRLMLAMALEHLDDPTATQQITPLLEQAHAAARSRVTVAKWWWGTEVERAWAALREAEEQLFEHRRASDGPMIDTDVVSHAKRYLGADDPRLVKLLEISDDPTAASSMAPGARKAVQVTALRAAHDEADRQHNEARFFRNRLLLATTGCLVSAAGLLAMQAALPKAPFLAKPDDWDGRPWQVLLVAMAFGMVGALITGIPALAAVPSDFSPFNLPLQQALLKFVFGAITATVGLLVVGSGLVTVADVEGVIGMIVLAVVFGAAQQLVTQFVDKRAAEILDPPTA